MRMAAWLNYTSVKNIRNYLGSLETIKRIVSTIKIVSNKPTNSWITNYASLLQWQSNKKERSTKEIANTVENSMNEPVIAFSNDCFIILNFTNVIASSSFLLCTF